MMKKNDVIQRLNDGGRILVDSIYRRAQVCDASGENWETVRYDVAERLQHTPGYKKVKTDWYASFYIEAEKEASQEITTAEAAEMLTEAMRDFERAGVISNLKIEPLSAEKIAEIRGHKEAPEAEKTAEEWAAESERVQAATLAALAGMIPAETEEKTETGSAFLNTSDAQSGQEEELEEIQEDAEPVYLEERWPESNEEPGVWYSIEWPAGLPTIYHTASDFRTAVHQARHNGRHIEAAWRHDWRNAGNVGTRRAIIPETSQEKTDRENWQHCQRIAEELEEYAAGNVYKCPECGHECTWEEIEAGEHEDETGWAVYTCQDCGQDVNENDWEQLSLYDYFSDCLDVEYRCGSDREYRSVCIMIACGGPNIYVDTAEKAVLLYWWTDRARHYLSSDAAEAVDAWAEEYWNCL